MARIIGAVSIIIATAALAACSAQGAKEKGGYRVVKRGGEDYFCRNEAVTGSRLEVHEVCMTKQQMDRVRDHTQEEVRRMQTPIFEPDVPNTAPGAGG